MSKEDPTVVQRVLHSGALALESTMIRLRRLKKDEPPPKSEQDFSMESGKSEGFDTPGRIEHDARGSAVWNWAVETSASALENTQRLLKRLETPHLSLDDKPAKPEVRDTSGGYDPYNRDRPTRKR